MNKRRLTLTLFVGAISLSVATLSMSVAWYASANRLRIESISITIDCDRQLAISTKPDEGFKTKLDNDDLYDCGVFYPVTSGHTEWLDNRQQTPLFYMDTGYSDSESGQISSLMEYGFFSQKLYLKADDNVIVSINPNESFIKAKKDVNHAYAIQLHERDSSYTVEEYEAQLNHLVNAMRYSVLITDQNDYDFIIVDPNKSTDTYYAGILDVNNDDYYDYYTSSKDGFLYERVYGEINDEQYLVYDAPDYYADSDYKDINEEPNAFNAKHKRGVHRFNLEKSLEKGLVIKKEESHTLDEFSDNTKPFYFPVYKDKPQEIVLSIYIEGWDLDSVNYTMGATFDSSLTFNIEREM